MEVRIKVGASVDQSLRFAFRPLVQSAIEARRLITREFAQVPREIAAAMGTVGRGGAFRAVVTEARRADREVVASARLAAREQSTIARELERQRTQSVRAALAEMKREHSSFAREQAAISRRADREWDRFATRTSHRTSRFLTPNLPIASVARRAAVGFLGGMGLDTTFTGAAQRNIALESAAVAATNQARMSGQEIAPAAVESAVQGARKKWGIKGDEVSGGLSQFQALTGELKLGLELVDDLGKRSAGTGATFNNLGAAAGNIAANLGNVANKGPAVLKVLDAWTMQGADGAVEIGHLTTQGSKLAALSSQFAGDKTENMIKLGAIAQVARASGGATSAQMAGTAVSSFANTLTKGARLKEFRKLGIEPSQLDPFELIRQIVTKTGGDEEKWSKLVMDVQAKRAVRGFASAYREAGGGEKGKAAMEGVFAKFMKGGISQETLQKNADAQGKTTAAQVEKLQAELDEVARELQSQLLPVLKEAQPTIVKFVRAMADLASWAAGNPWKAVIAALAASILRAGIESALRNAIERALSGGGGGAGALIGGGYGGAAAGGRLGMLHKAQNVAGAATLAAFGVGAAMDQANSLAKVTGSKATLTDLIPGFRGGKFKGTDELLEDIMDVSIMAPIRAFTKDGQKNWKRKFGVIGEQGDAVFNMDARMNADARARFAAEQKPKPTETMTPEQLSKLTGRPGENLEAFKARLLEGKGAAADEAAQRALQDKANNSLIAFAEKAGAGGINVNVQNFPEEGGDAPTAPGGDT